MPDDPNRFDDDLLPDWFARSAQEDTGKQDSVPAPWDIFPGRYPEPPGHEQPGPAPWQIFAAPVLSPYGEEGEGVAPWGAAGAPALGHLDWFGAGQEEAPAEPGLPPPATPSAGTTDDWLSSFGEAAGYSRAVPAEPGGELDWLTAPEAPAETAPPSAPLSDWQALRQEWLAQSSLEEAPQLPAEEFALPGWLDEETPGEPLAAEDLPLFEPPAGAEPEPPDQGALDWLTPPEEETPPAPVIRRLTPLPEPPAASLPAEDLPLFEPPAGAEPEPPDQGALDWLTPPEEEQPSSRLIRRLTPAAPEPPAEEVEAGMPAWLSEQTLPPEETVPAGMTYEEWERQQHEQEAEAQKSPEERLLEEIPDWFKQLDEALPAPPPPLPQEEGPEFVPGWYLGLEEKTQEAPDWFQRLDLSTGPLAEVTPPAEPPIPAPAEPEVPDWFRATPELEGMDWATLGGLVPSEPEQGAVPDWLETGATADAHILPAEEIPFPELDLEYAPPLPAAPGDEEVVEDFVERFEPLEPGEFNRQAALSADDTPDWLRELPGGAPPAEPAAPPLDEEDVWAAPAAPSADQALDWLDIFGPEAQEPAPIEELPVPPAPAPEAEEPATAFDLLETAALDSAALDALLSAGEMTKAPSAEPEPEIEPPVASLQDLEALFAGAAVEGEVPDLQRLFDQGELDRVLGEEAPSAPQPEPSLPPKSPAPPAVSSAQPEWVEELRPADLPVTIKAAGAEASVRQRQVTELPERLRALRERALRELGPLQAEASAGGALTGIPDALPAAELVIPAAVSPRSPVALAITPEQEQRVQRLQALLDIGGDTDEETLEEAARVAFGEAETLEVPALPARRPRRPRRFRLDRLMVMLGMLVALLAPFVTDALQFAANPSPLRGKQAAVAAAVDALQAGQYVLFAFEYGPAAAGELDPLAQAVLRDVLARGAVPLTISTDPAGAFHARAVVAALGDDPALLGARGLGEEALQAGEDYVTLRYLSGEAVGVRLLHSVVWNPDGTLAGHPVFTTDLRGDSTNLPIGNVAQDLALLVVIGDQVMAIRTWAEQLSDLAVPKVALVTAAVEPLAVPYVGRDGYVGYLAGVRDTMRYDTERNADTRTPYQMPADLPVKLPDPQTARWHSMALGAAAAAGFIALGAVINLLRALRRRESR